MIKFRLSDDCGMLFTMNNLSQLSIVLAEKFRLDPRSLKIECILDLDKYPIGFAYGGGGISNTQLISNNSIEINFNGVLNSYEDLYEFIGKIFNILYTFLYRDNKLHITKVYKNINRNTLECEFMFKEPNTYALTGSFDTGLVEWPMSLYKEPFVVLCLFRYLTGIDTHISSCGYKDFRGIKKED